MVFTSYFANKKDILGDTIAIANILPQNIQIDKYNPLVPDIDLVNAYKQGKVDNKAFNEKFYYQLERLDPKQVYKDIEDKTLLCYEKPSEFCHRILVRKWLAKHNKMAIEYKKAYEVPVIIPKDYNNKTECFIIIDKLLSKFRSNQKITFVSDHEIIKEYVTKKGIPLKKLDLGYNKYKADFVIIFSEEYFAKNILNDYGNVHKIFLVYEYDKKNIYVKNNENDVIKNTLF